MSKEQHGKERQKHHKEVEKVKVDQERRHEHPTETGSAGGD